MSLTSDDIARIANLARLELHPEESERMLTQINGFFGIVEAMRAVDTTGVEPLAHPVAVMQDVALRLRDDVASEPNEREANQRSAPAVADKQVVKPRSSPAVCSSSSAYCRRTGCGSSRSTDSSQLSSK